MKAQAALVRADGRIVLDPVAAVNLDLALIIHPVHPEGDDALRLGDALQNAILLILAIFFKDGREALQYFLHSLKKDRLAAVAFFQTLHHALHICHSLLLFSGAETPRFTDPEKFLTANRTACKRFLPRALRGGRCHSTRTEAYRAGSQRGAPGNECSVFPVPVSAGASPTPGASGESRSAGTSPGPGMTRVSGLRLYQANHME